MNNGYVLLIEKEEMWARMLTQVLEDNHIPCVAFPVYGAGLSIKTGIQERLQVYVPAKYLTPAAALVEELFSAGSILEDE